MTSARSFDLVVKGGVVLNPASGSADEADVGIADGRIAAVGPGLSTEGAGRVINRGRRLCHSRPHRLPHPQLLGGEPLWLRRRPSLPEHRRHHCRRRRFGGACQLPRIQAVHCRAGQDADAGVCGAGSTRGVDDAGRVGRPAVRRSRGGRGHREGEPRRGCWDQGEVVEENRRRECQGGTEAGDCGRGGVRHADHGPRWRHGNLHGGDLGHAPSGRHHDALLYAAGAIGCR